VQKGGEFLFDHSLLLLLLLPHDLPRSFSEITPALLELKT